MAVQIGNFGTARQRTGPPCVVEWIGHKSNGIGLGIAHDAAQKRQWFARARHWQNLAPQRGECRRIRPSALYIAADSISEFRNAGHLWIKLPIPVMRRDTINKEIAARKLRLANRKIDHITPVRWRHPLQCRSKLQEHIIVEKTIFGIELHSHEPFRNNNAAIE